MKRQGDIEGVLEAWFLDGPMEMPDRLFGAVLDQVERVPQRRLARLQLRFTDMSPTARLLVAAGATTLVLGIGVAAVGALRSTPSTAPTVPTPAASPSNVFSGPPVAEELRHGFVGEFRSEPPAPGAQDRSIIAFTDDAFSYNGSMMTSQASSPSANTVLVRSGASAHCPEGAEGEYSWSASPGYTKVTFTLVRDVCDARAAVIPGEWLRSDCANPENFCLGILEAETYSTFYVRPDLAEGGAWRPEFGAVSYTVPEGWANGDDWLDHYGLMRAGPYTAGESGDGAVAPDAITLLVRPGAARLDGECPEANEPGVGRTRADLSAWILAHPGLVVTQQPDVTIDGLTATVLDLAVRDDWIETCDETAPFVAAPVFFNGYHWSLAKNDRMRVILVDLPGGTSTAIVIDVESPSTFDALLAETMPIVESFDFE